MLYHTRSSLIPDMSSGSPTEVTMADSDDKEWDGPEELGLLITLAQRYANHSLTPADKLKCRDLASKMDRVALTDKQRRALKEAVRVLRAAFDVNGYIPVSFRPPPPQEPRSPALQKCCRNASGAYIFSSLDDSALQHAQHWCAISFIPHCDDGKLRAALAS